MASCYLFFIQGICINDGTRFSFFFLISFHSKTTPTFGYCVTLSHSLRYGRRRRHRQHICELSLWLFVQKINNIRQQQNRAPPPVCLLHNSRHVRFVYLLSSARSALFSLDLGLIDYKWWQVEPPRRWTSLPPFTANQLPFWTHFKSANCIRSIAFYSAGY